MKNRHAWVIIARNLIALCIVVVVTLILQSCGVFTGQRTEQGWLRDRIYSYEPLLNGMHKVWMTHDDLAAFCTDDDSLGAQLKEIVTDTTQSPYVLLEYRSVFEGDSEYSAWTGSGGKCVPGDAVDTRMYKILSVQRAP